MNGQKRIVIGGELHLTLQAVAECYRVEVAWLQDAYDLGMLGRGRRQGETIVIAARMLDRVAEIVRLHVYYSLDLNAIVPMLVLED